jgi:hypothetical protein
MKKHYLDKFYSRENKIRNGKAHRRQVKKRVSYNRAVKRAERREALEEEGVKDILVFNADMV